MTNATQNLILPRQAFQNKGMVFLSLMEYEKIREKIERLEREKEFSQEEAETLKIIAEGEREYREGKLKSIKSLSDIE